MFIEMIVASDRLKRKLPGMKRLTI